MSAMLAVWRNWATRRILSDLHPVFPLCRSHKLNPRRQAVMPGGPGVGEAAVAGAEAGATAEFPQRGVQAVADHAGMAGCAEIGLAEIGEHTRHKFAQCVADADTLEFGEADAAVLTPAGSDRVREGKHGDEGGGLVLVQRHEAARRGVKFSAQIVMRAEKRPTR